MKIALVQQNYTVCDLKGNGEKIFQALKEAGEGGADLAVTSELALLGYPPRDILLQKPLINRSMEVLEELAKRSADLPPLLIGMAQSNPSMEGRPLYNTAFLLHRGAIQSSFPKSLLPTYDVFDEDRYFEPALGGPHVVSVHGWKFGITICEDLWNDRDFWDRPRYHSDPVERLVKAGANCILNLSASPFNLRKQKAREAMLGAQAAKHKVPLIYVNQVGGNDDLLFDGRSCVFNRSGEVVGRGKAFTEDLLLIDLDNLPSPLPLEELSLEEELWKGLVMGTRDYGTKCGFKRVLLGLSGGIDSALTAVIAKEALGAEAVQGVLMPSPYSSQSSIDDSLELGKNLGIETLTLPIEKLMKAFDEALEKPFQGYSPDVTEENIQARIRGNLLMALSNKGGSLLLTTGNKSEMAVGYCTLYGDMSGGLAVLADVSKTLVYRLSKWINRKGEVIPENILIKAPSAELRPDQTDQDSLPPYDVLDSILALHIEQYLSLEEIVDRGYERETVKKILRLVKIAEFKRKQAPPGLKVTSRAFGTGWRMPIASKDWNGG